MSKIVNILEQQKDYKLQLQETRDYLESVRDELFIQMINIASQGPWKAWMNGIETGAEFFFTKDILENTGDKNVETLWELYYKLEEVEERLKDGSF